METAVMRRARTAVAAIATILAGIIAGFAAETAATSTGSAQIAIEYLEPTRPEHRSFRDLLRDNHILESVRDLLAVVRWPRPLRLELKGCEGVSNAWYEDGIITVCYEYLDDIWRAANSSRRPAAIAREDAIAGPTLDVFLHEASHAAFNLLNVPIFGREEDAADQLAAYYVLQLPSDRRHKLILGSAYAYASELKVRRARDLKRPRLKVARHITFADEHGTPAQRLYNLLCLAYGSDKVLFADVVKMGFLPSERAEQCEDEYKQIDYAYRMLIAPHVVRK
ncbi:MAG TPA: DUF4344 domain-containing metallopeptidase [Terriglobales bacterium]|nr:DUF4344 domain-containing metallopeptidase [Terriglobales bacterium]